MAYTKLTDREKKLKGIEVFPSGEGLFFDDANQSVNSRYKRGLGGGLNNKNSYNTDEMPSGLHYGRPNSVQDAEAFTDTFEQSGAFVAPNGLLFGGIISADHNGDNINYLSNSKDREVATFKQINSYIHYVPNAAGGVGELDQSAFYYGYNPLAGTPVTDKFYRYGKPT
jgi:hypothetical protein